MFRSGYIALCRGIIATTVTAVLFDCSNHSDHNYQLFSCVSGQPLQKGQQKDQCQTSQSLLSHNNITVIKTLTRSLVATVSFKTSFITGSYITHKVLHDQHGRACSVTHTVNCIVWHFAVQTWDRLEANFPPCCPHFIMWTLTVHL